MISGNMTRKKALFAISSILVVFLALCLYGGFVYYHKVTPSRAPILPTNTKYIALTFDDGPYGEATSQILAILKDKQVHATFFLLGQNVRKYPDLTRQIVLEGHVIGNHSDNHSRFLPLFSAKALDANITRAQETITQTTGFAPTLFRPPYGNESLPMRQEVIREGYTIAGYDIDPRDWDHDRESADAIVAHVLENAKPGAVILLHDGRDTHINYPRDNTIAALPQIIEKLRTAGYTFVTLDTLFNVSAYRSFLPQTFAGFNAQ